RKENDGDVGRPRDRSGGRGADLLHCPGGRRLSRQGGGKGHGTPPVTARARRLESSPGGGSIACRSGPGAVRRRGPGRREFPRRCRPGGGPRGSSIPVPGG